MSAKIIDGKEISLKVKEQVKEKARIFEEKYGRKVCLAVILVGNDPASEVYVRNKIKGCEMYKFSYTELDVKKEWIGKNLLELNLRKKYSINVIAVKDDNKIEIDIDPNVPLTDKMKLVVIGKTSKLSKIK